MSNQQLRKCIQRCHECCKRSCVGLHKPEAQSKVFQDEVLAIAEEPSEGEAEDLRRQAEVRSMSVNEASVE